MDLFDEISIGLVPQTIGVEQFAEDKQYCDKALFPRQTALLKLIFLEEMTGAEEDILSEWIASGTSGGEVLISPDIRERRDYLRGRGYKHFREVQLVGGRRSSKGFITGICMAKAMWDTLQLGDPHDRYGIDKGKEIFFSCVAASEAQAKEFQYGDLVSTVETCRAFEPYLQKSLETEFRVATPADLRRIAAARARGSGSKIERDTSKLRGKALAANAGTLRGSATMAQPLSARVWTPTGWVTMGEIQVGDAIMGSNGEIQTVTHIHPKGEQRAYRVTFSDGSSTICNDDHLWTMHQKGRGSQTKPLSEFRNNIHKGNGSQVDYAKWSLPAQPVLTGGDYRLPNPLHPYLLGVMLGDGSMTQRVAKFYNEDETIIEAVRQVLPTDHVITYRGNIGYDLCTTGRKNLIIRALKEVGVWGHLGPVKFIPERCLTMTSFDRLSLLQGLLDTDGTVNGTSVRFGSSSRDLALGVMDLVRSLGGYATLCTEMREGIGISGRSQGEFFIVCISGLDATTLFRSECKRSRATKYKRYQQRYRRLVSVEEVEPCEMQCITVSNDDGLYLTDDFIVTHNCIAMDEMAHMTVGESKASASEVYGAAIPSLSQFGVDGMIFCNPPEAPMWMADLSFKPIGEMQVGDRVMGWARQDGKVSRDLCDAEVTGVMRRESPLVKVTMESGRTFRCTPDHRWLTTSYGGKKGYYEQSQEWFCTPEEGREIVRVIDPTPGLRGDQMRDALWLGGMFDGEGHAGRGRQLTICQSRSANPLVCTRIEQALDNLGFKWVYHKIAEGGAYHILSPDKQAVVDFANWTGPTRVHQLQEKVMTGRWRHKDRIVSVEPDGFGEVIALTTSTGNYVCNGFASKNCNSSPYTKVGKFYEIFEVAMRRFDSHRDVALSATAVGVGEDGEVDMSVNGDPRQFSFEFPSWELYKGYTKYSSQYKPRPRGREHGKMPTASPDWDPLEVDAEGDQLYSLDDQEFIIGQRTTENSDPETFKVEQRGQFAEVVDAFLIPSLVDRMYMGIPIGTDVDADGSPKILYNRLTTDYGAGASNEKRYKFHLDPSSTTAGFGFAIAHIEHVTNPLTGDEEEHCVFDMVKRWDPKNFPGHVIRWKPILEDVAMYADIFRPYEITFDQHQSAEPIQTLQEMLNKRNIVCAVYEKVATNESNWKGWQVLKTAIYQGLVHAPYDEFMWNNPTSQDELKFLQEMPTGGKYPKVEKQDIGPVRTKDQADCIRECVFGLIGNLMSTRMRERLGNGGSFGAMGGYGIGQGGPVGGAGPVGISEYYSSREQKASSGRGSSLGRNAPMDRASLTRSALGGRGRYTGSRARGR